MTITSETIVSNMYPKNTSKDAKSEIRVALPQVLAVIVKNILLLAYGTTVGYPTILIPSLSADNTEETFHLNDDQISWIGSINMMCVPIGCFLSGFVTQPLGRKRSMQFINIPLLASWIIFRYSTQVWHIYLALGITGLCGGLFEAPILTYVAEITQPHLRGMLSATSTFSLIIGILLQFMLGTFLNWRTVALVCTSLPILSFILLLFIPESPHWLIMKGRTKEARKSLAWLRGWTTVEEIETEFQEILNHNKDSSINDTTKNSSINNDITKQDTSEVSEKLTAVAKINKYYLKKSFLWPLFIVCFFFFVPHFTGSTTLQIYAVLLFSTMEAPINKYYATIILGLAEFFGCVISVAMVHYTGKRVMGLVSILGNGICAVVVASYAYVQSINYFPPKNESNIFTTETLDTAMDSYKWIPLLFLILLAFLSHCGLRSLSWILIGEVFSKETRGIGCGIASGVGYIFGFSSNKIFLRSVSLLTIPGMYWFYGSFSFLSAIILYFILPETEGKTLQEITDHFAGISKLDNKIHRSKQNVHSTENIETQVYDSRL